MNSLGRRLFARELPLSERSFLLLVALISMVVLVMSLGYYNRAYRIFGFLTHFLLYVSKQVLLIVSVKWLVLLSGDVRRTLGCPKR